MSKNVRQFVSASCFWAVGVVAAVVSTTYVSGCSGEVDPGICETTGQFRKVDVQREYAEMLCGDWVRLLVSNCVAVAGLSDYPSDLQIGAFCGRVTSSSGDYHAWGFEHSCNFVDNPELGCQQLAGIRSGTSDAAYDFSNELETALRPAIEGSPALQESTGNVRINIQGITLLFGNGQADPGN